jgi:hypothetical protein
VLAEVGRAGVDTIVVGGDVVPGPMLVETIERLRAIGDRALFVRGNGDRWVVEAFDASGSLGEEHDHPGRPWVAWTPRRSTGATATCWPRSPTAWSSTSTGSARRCSAMAPDRQREFARRAGQVIEVDAGHHPFLSQPAAVRDLVPGLA